MRSTSYDQYVILKVLPGKVSHHPSWFVYFGNRMIQFDLLQIEYLAAKLAVKLFTTAPLHTFSCCINVPLQCTYPIHMIGDGSGSFGVRVTQGYFPGRCRVGAGLPCHAMTSLIVGDELSISQIS